MAMIRYNRMEEPYWQGYSAGNSGREKKDNPYVEWEEKKEWEEGYDEGKCGSGGEI